jgi:hypothetical protein
MTLTSKPLAIIVVLILFGGIFGSDALGWWETESTKQAAVFTTGEFAGQANPADIRGSYTFGDVEANFGISPSLLAQAFGIQTTDPAAYPVKSLESVYLGSPQEIGTASVRLFVAFYLGLPYDLSADVYLPESAAQVLQARSLSPEQLDYLAGHTIAFTPAQPEDIQPVEPPASQAGESADESHDSETDRMVKGKTTFAEVLSWGVSQAEIEQVLGMPMPASTGIKVKDFCSANGLSFETVKTGLQLQIDQVK